MLHPNWADLYEAITAIDPDAEAIVQGDRRITWREFDDTSSRLAATFAGWGLEPGARVALYLYNVPEYLELAYGAFKARVGADQRQLPLPVRRGALPCSTTPAAEVLVFHGALAEQVAAARPPTGPPTSCRSTTAAAPLLDGAEWYHEVVASTSPMAPVERRGDDQLILYTGGTTGIPKGVVWHHGDLFQTLSYPAYVAAGIEVPTTVDGVAEAAAALRAAGASPVMVSAPPLIHGTALFLAMAAFVRGGTVVLLEGRRFDAGELWRARRNASG